MKAKGIMAAVFLAVVMIIPTGVRAASEMELCAAFASPVMEKEGEQKYEWTLTNDSPYDIVSLCICADGTVIREMDKLKPGESVSGWGIMDIADEDFERYICFSAEGYSDIPNEDPDFPQKKFTRHIESCCNAVASKSAPSKQLAIPTLPGLRLPSETEKPSFDIEACAYVQSSLIPSGTENELLVFIKNDGNTDASKLELLLKKDVVAQTETLSAGKSLILRCPVKPEPGQSIQPVLRYKDEKGKTRSKKMEKIQFYKEDELLKVSLRAEDESPTPQAETKVYIDINNTGEKTISGIKLFDHRGNPVQLPASKLKSGETMRAYAEFQLQRETDISFCARYSNKTTVVSVSEPLYIVPEIPEGTAGLKLSAVPDKKELQGSARDMITFTFRLANGGSYPLSGVLLKNGDQVIGSRDILPAGEEAVFRSAYRLDGASELIFTASAADETGKPRSCSTIVNIPAGRDFQSQN